MFHFHRFGPWQLKNEIPLWRHERFKDRVSAGDRPQVMRNYYITGNPQLYCRPETDWDYLLVGKLIEQARKCGSCGKVEYAWQKVTI